MRKTRLLAAKLGKQQAAGFPLGEREQRNQQQGSPRMLWAHLENLRTAGIDTCWGKTHGEPLLGVCAAWINNPAGPEARTALLWMLRMQSCSTGARGMLAGEPRTGCQCCWAAFYCKKCLKVCLRSQQKLQEKSPSLAKAALPFSAQVHQEFSSEVQDGSLSQGVK